MTKEAKFIERMTREQRHQQVLTSNAFLQGRNTRLETRLKLEKSLQGKYKTRIKELESLTLWGFIKKRFF